MKVINKYMTDLKQKVIDVLKEIYDPEIPVNVYDLGLIYEIDIKEDNTVFILMTLTSPKCPVGDYLQQLVEDDVGSLEEVSNVIVELTFEPMWTPDRVAQEVREELGLINPEDLEKNKNKIENTNLVKCCICGKIENDIPIIECFYREKKDKVCIKCLKNF